MTKRILASILIVVILLTTFALPVMALPTEILRPDGVGSETSLDYGADPHWAQVDEAVADEGTTFIGTLSTTYLRDLYALPAHSGSGVINSVTVYIRIKNYNASVFGYGKTSLRTEATAYDGTEHYKGSGESWETFSEVYTLNPNTGVAWTWTQIDALEVGVSLKTAATNYMWCTQVYVEVDYTPPVPTVTNSAATNITSVGADLHGEITATGGENATVRGFEWDVDTGAPYANDWHENGDYGTGTFDHPFTDMPSDTTIYWRAYATNTAGTGYSGELSFDTLLPLPLAPTDFTITESGVDEVTLTWTTGTYAATTYIRVEEDNYPADRTDGWLVYDGALETATLDGLELTYGTYCFRAWSENATGFSIDTTDEKIGGEMLLLILFGFLGLGFTVAFFWKQVGFLGYGAAGMWALLGFTAFQTSTSTSPAAITDTYMALFWLCIAFVIGCVLLPTVMRPKPSRDDLYADDIDPIDRPLHESFKKDEEDRAYLDKIMPRRARRERNPRKPSGSVFDKTGIIGRVKK